MSNELWYVRDRNKVLGPFNREQLDALRRRGQLARFHEVSQDRKTWTNASTVASLFAPGSAPAGGGTPPKESAPSWYYSSGKTPLGPVPKEEILAQLRLGTISADALVWTEGMPNWIPIRDAGLERPAANPGTTNLPTTAPRPAMTGRNRRRQLAIVAVAVAAVVLIAIVVALYVNSRRGPGARRDRSNVSWLGASTAIDSVEDAPDLASAVGLVLCGATVTEFDGTKTESCFTTGTCFVASSDGYLITNRHVINEISKLINADRLRSEIEEKTRLKLEPQVWVFLRRQKYAATIHYQSDDFDLAVLKIKPKQPLPHFRLAAGKEIPRGTPVFALGFPDASRLPLSGAEAIERNIGAMKKGVRIESHFQPSNFEYVITDGIVSLLRREGGTLKIEHTARISGGNSGGPLVTSDGTVVGINTWLAREAENAVPTYVALGVAQFEDELARHVPEISEP